MIFGQIYVSPAGADTFTSATGIYFAIRGLFYIYRGWRRAGTSHLHLKEWIDCPHHPSCWSDHGFAEAMAAHTGTLFNWHNKKVLCDRGNEKIVLYKLWHLLT